MQSGISQAQTQRNIVQQRLSQAQTQRAGLVEKKFSPMHKQYRGTQIMVERGQVKERAKQREYLSGYERKAKEHLGEISEYETEAEGYIGELGEHEAKIKGYEKEGYTPEKTDEGYTFSKTEMVRQKVRHEVSSGVPEVSQKLIWDKPVQRGGKTVWERRTTQVSNIHLERALSQVTGYGGRVVSITSMAAPQSKHYKYTYEYKPVTTTKKEIVPEQKVSDIEAAPVFSLGHVQKTDYKLPEMDASMKKTMDARALWAGGAITGGTATTEFMTSQPGFEQKMQRYIVSEEKQMLKDRYGKQYYVGKTPEGEGIYAPKTPSLIETGKYTEDPDWKTIETKISKGISEIDTSLPMLKSQLEMLKGVPSGTEFEFDINQDNIIQADEKMTAGELIPVVKGYIFETEKSKQELIRSRSMLGKYKELGYEVNISDDELSLIVPGEKGSIEYEKEADIQRVMESGTPVQRVASVAKFWTGGFTSQDPFWTKSIGESLFGEEKGKSERLFETRVKTQMALRRAKGEGNVLEQLTGVYKEMYKPGTPAFAITAAAIGGKAFGLGMGGISGISPIAGKAASVVTGGYFLGRTAAEIKTLASTGYGVQWGGALGLIPAGLATTTAEGESIGPSPIADCFSSIAMMGVSAPFAMRAFGSGFRTGHKYGSGVKSFISESFPTIRQPRGLKVPSERSLRFWDKYYSAKTKTSDALYKFGLERGLVGRRPTRSVGYDWDIHTDPRMTGEYDVALMRSRGIGADRFMSYKGKSYFPSYDSWGFHSEGMMLELPGSASRMFSYADQQFFPIRPSVPSVARRFYIDPATGKAAVEFIQPEKQFDASGAYDIKTGRFEPFAKGTKFPTRGGFTEGGKIYTPRYPELAKSGLPKWADSGFIHAVETRTYPKLYGAKTITPELPSLSTGKTITKTVFKPIKPKTVSKYQSTSSDFYFPAAEGIKTVGYPKWSPSFYHSGRSGWAGTSLAELEAMESGIGGRHKYWKSLTPAIDISKPSIAKGVDISSMLGIGIISAQASESMLGQALMQESLLSTALITKQEQVPMSLTSQLSESMLGQALMQESLLSTALISKQEQVQKQLTMQKMSLISVPMTAPVLDIFPKPRIDRPHARPIIPFLPLLDEEERPRKTKKRKPKKRKRGYRERKHPVRMYDIFGGM